MNATRMLNPPASQQEFITLTVVLHISSRCRDYYGVEALRLIYLIASLEHRSASRGGYLPDVSVVTLNAARVCTMEHGELV